MSDLVIPVLSALVVSQIVIGSRGGAGLVFIGIMVWIWLCLASGT